MLVVQNALFTGSIAVVLAVEGEASARNAFTNDAHGGGV